MQVAPAVSKAGTPSFTSVDAELSALGLDGVHDPADLSLEGQIRVTYSIAT